MAAAHLISAFNSLNKIFIVVVVVVYLHDNITIQQNSRKQQTCQAKQDPQEKLLKTYKMRTLFTTS